MEIGPKVSQLTQIAQNLESCLSNHSQWVEKQQQLAWSRQLQEMVGQLGSTAGQAMQQKVQQLESNVQQLQQQINTQVEGLRPQWNYIKSDLDVNVLPNYAPDAKAIIDLVIWHIDTDWKSGERRTPHDRVASSSSVSNLKLLGFLLQNPVRLIAQPDPLVANQSQLTPKEVSEIFDKGATDTNQQISIYTAAGWAALVFGLVTAAAAVAIPFKWDIPPQIGALAFISALLARLLAIGVLVYVASILIQRHKDMVHLAARAREFRAHMKMISAVPFFAGDKNRLDALTTILKDVREKQVDSGGATEKGFFLPAELINSLGPLLAGLAAKK